MDEIDRKLVNILRKNSKISNQELSRLVNLVPSAVHKRVSKLEKENIISGYTIRLNHNAIGSDMNILINVITSESAGATEIGRQMAAFPEICDVFDVAGNTSYIVRAVVKDTAGLNDLIIRMGQIPGVMRTQTTLIMNVLKNELSAEL